MNKQLKLNMSKDLNVVPQNQTEKAFNLLEDIGKILPIKKSIKTPVKKKKAVMKKKVVAKKNPVAEKTQSKMYVDFPLKPEAPAKAETSEIRPTKISIIIQLMGLLNTLLPNRELFYAVVKLVKVFISVAFTLSAIYASCIIYSNIFEWLFNFLTKAFKRSFEGALSYLPKIQNSLIIQKVLSFLLGVEAQPPINTYKYLPDFVYNMWLATKVLWSQPIFKFFFWALVGFVVLTNIWRFILYASSLPGSWAKKIKSAIGHYVWNFLWGLYNFFQAILEFFRGMGKPGTGWLSIFWSLENAEDKTVLSDVKHGLKNVSSQLNRLSQINGFLESVHENPGEDNLFYNRNKITSEAAAGEECINQFRHEVFILRDLVEKLNDRETLAEYTVRLNEAERKLQRLEADFIHWIGLYDARTFSRKTKPKDDENNKSVFDSKDTKTRTNPVFDSSPNDKNKPKPVPEDDKQKPKPALNPEDVDLEETDDPKGKKS